MNEVIKKKALKAVGTYEVVDETCRKCYVDGYADGYEQALADCREATLAAIAGLTNKK